MAPPLGELLHKLTQHPSAQSRAVVAERVASGFVDGEFKAAERQIAVEIFRVLVNDAEVMVRKMLSTHLATSMDAPHDIVFKLAKDIAEVALPMLEHSYVLTEDDLIAITKSTEDVTVMSAIARRETVSRELSQALLQKSNATVIETLLENRSASIDEKDLHGVYTTHGNRGNVLELMVRRGGLPVTLAEKIFSAVSDELKRVMTQQYRLSLQVADDATRDVREMATLGLVDPHMRNMEIGKLVEQLYHQGKLTLSIILRSLCQGDIRFFGHALSRLSDVPYNNAQLLILDQGSEGFKSLYKTSCLPMELFSATSYLLKAVLEETGFGRFMRQDIRQRLTTRLLQDESTRQVKYLDYLLTLIQTPVTREVAVA